MTELTLPANVSDLTQEQYLLYIKEVKALLFQLPGKQALVTPDSLSSVSSAEIVSIPQQNGGILIQLRAIPTNVDEAVTLYNQLTRTEKAQFLKATGITP